MSSRRLSSRTEKVNLFLKWFFYILVICFVYLLSTIKFTDFAKPLMLIPVAICISARENETIASSVGMVCGFMLDSAGGKLFGFNAFILMICCMFTSLLFHYLLRQSFVSSLLITFTVTVIQGLLDFLFFYGIWTFDNVHKIFTRWYLPSMIFTVISFLPLYILIKFISSRFGIKEEHYIEEKDENIVRE